MKRVIAAMTAALMVLAVAGTAIAASPGTAPGKNKLTCFTSGVGAHCTLNTSGAKGSATLTVTSLPSDADVYYTGYNNSIYGVLLSNVTQLSFTYTGTPTAGSPRFSVPIAESALGTTDAFAFIGARDCNNGARLVDVINDATCNVNYKSIDYQNWATFAAAFPAASVAFDNDVVFVIADDIGTWTVNNVTIGKPGK